MGTRSVREEGVQCDKEEAPHGGEARGQPVLLWATGAMPKVGTPRCSTRQSST